MINEFRQRIDDLDRKVSAALMVSGIEGQLALLCGVCEGLISNTERTGAATVRDIDFLKQTLKALPWYKEWRGEGGLK